MTNLVLINDHEAYMLIHGRRVGFHCDSGDIQTFVDSTLAPPGWRRLSDYLTAQSIAEDEVTAVIELDSLSPLRHTEPKEAK